MDSFLEYFQENYCTRINQWATHARCYTSVNTNMHIEAFHRLVKTVYFQQKQNRRVDALLNCLLKLSRDKSFERLQKTEKGKNTHRIAEINKRHKNAEGIFCELILTNSSNRWEINSQHGHNCYTIKKCLHHESCSCPMQCSHCGVCIHMYSCTRLDSILHNTVCKHVHLIHMQQQQHLVMSKEQGTSSDETMHPADEPQSNTLEDLNPSHHGDYSATFHQYLELEH